MAILYGIQTIAERSILAVFQSYASYLPGVQLTTGQADTLRTTPIIILNAANARPHPDFGGTPMGNFEITFQIACYSSADDNTLETHLSRVEAIQGIMQDVATLQSNWTQGALKAAWIVNNEYEEADRRYGNVITYNLVAVYPPAGS